MKLKERLNRFLDEIEDEVNTSSSDSLRENVFAQELKKEMATVSKESSFANINLGQSPERMGAMSVIAFDAKVYGDVSTSESLKVNGSIIGNIHCAKHLQLNGDVEGDVKVGSIELRNCVLRGNISCEEDVIVDVKSEIHGDCWNDNISLHGIIRGNIYAKGKIRLHSTAEVIGSVSGTNIMIDDGAAIQGNIKIKRN